MFLRIQISEKLTWSKMCIATETSFLTKHGCLLAAPAPARNLTLAAPLPPLPPTLNISKTQKNDRDDSVARFHPYS